MLTVEELPKKVQYINIDSDFVNGTNNNFSVTFDLSSNVFIEEIRDVIGIKVVDFYITQIGENGLGTDDVAKYIDIICPEVPTSAQILDERKSQVLARIPIECNFSGSSSYVKHDKQWKSFNRKTNYFNPLSIKKLNFEIYELQGDGDYVSLQPDTSFFFTLEITTIDHKAPPEDKNLRVMKSIEKLCKKIDKFNYNIQQIPREVMAPETVKKKIPVWKVGAVIALLVGAFMYYNRTRAPVPQPVVPS